MAKRALPNVTLLGIDCVNVERLQAAMDVSMKDFDFGAVKLLTSLPTDDPRLVKIPHIGTIEEYSRFCIEDLKGYVDTDFVLVVQYDGFILNPQSWSDDFLGYDFIGAPWLVADWSIERFAFPAGLKGTWIVGNGGFCIRSKRFLETSARLSSQMPGKHPEDVAMLIWHRKLFEDAGIRIATVDLAMRFSIEGDDVPFDKQFGFHGLPWTDIGTWVTAHPEYPLIAAQFNAARAAHFAREKARGIEYLEVLNDDGSGSMHFETYGDVHAKGLLHRTAHVWIMNSRGELLIQKRSMKKRAYPGMWDISAAGHVSAYETSLDAAKKETEEELGLKLSDDAFELVSTIRAPRNVIDPHFIDDEYNDVYLVRNDLDLRMLKLEAAEVDAVRWISPAELRDWAAGRGEPVVPHTEEYDLLFKKLIS